MNFEVGMVTLASTGVHAVSRSCQVLSLGGLLIVVLMVRVLDCLMVEGGGVAGLVVHDRPCCCAVCEQAASKQGAARHALKMATDIMEISVGLDADRFGIAVEVGLLIIVVGVGVDLGLVVE